MPPTPADDTRPYALVVDDEALIRFDAVDILEAAGFRAHEAPTAEDALLILERHGASITLLFTDVQMGGAKTGLELARETASRWPHVGILVASGQINPKDGELPDGAVFVRKPFSADVIYNRLQQLLPDGVKPEPLKRG